MGVGAELRRNSGLPLLAATAIAAGNPVTITGPWQVTTVQGVTEPIVGIARATVLAKGEAVDIRDLSAGDVVRAVAAATIAAGKLVGYASNATAAGPEGEIVQVTKLGEISRGASQAVGTTFGVWTAGEAFESANPGNTIAFRVNPRQLSGLS